MSQNVTGWRTQMQWQACRCIFQWIKGHIQKMVSIIIHNHYNQALSWTAIYHFSLLIIFAKSYHSYVSFSIFSFFGGRGPRNLDFLNLNFLFFQWIFLYSVSCPHLSLKSQEVDFFWFPQSYMFSQAVKKLVFGKIPIKSSLNVSWKGGKHLSVKNGRNIWCKTKRQKLWHDGF